MLAAGERMRPPVGDLAALLVERGERLRLASRRGHAEQAARGIRSEHDGVVGEPGGAPAARDLAHDERRAAGDLHLAQLVGQRVADPVAVG